MLTLPIYFIVVRFCFCAEQDSFGNDTTRSLYRNSNVIETHEGSEFPEDLFTNEQKRNGAIVLHCVLAIYCFITIATVCTTYFMPTIQRICQVLKLSDDVAAATFMSIATSSPELFTNIIGTFVTNSDIGVGHVLGNAYYDMFFVAFLGGVSASKNIVLDWWPIARDCGIYLVVAITLTWTVWDGKIEIYESLILLALYIIYFVIMFSNRAIIRLLKSTFHIDIVDPVNDTFGVETNEAKNVKDGGDYTIVPTTVLVNGEQPLNCIQSVHSVQIAPASKLGIFCKQIGKILILPVVLLTGFTIPDVRNPRLINFYPISFVVCVCWIGVSTYLGTWMISTIGKTIGVPDIIMGMVFMAAGGSVVEAYGVWYKTRRGECSIGLSNSMGCNTLDATMCLALPWLIKSLLHKGPAGTSAINLASQVLHFNCSLLVISVVIMFMILYFNKFTLNWKLGLACGISYVTVLSIAITLEANQTGS